MWGRGGGKAEEKGVRGGRGGGQTDQISLWLGSLITLSREICCPRQSVRNTSIGRLVKLAAHLRFLPRYQQTSSPFPHHPHPPTPSPSKLKPLQISLSTRPFPIRYSPLPILCINSCLVMCVCHCLCRTQGPVLGTEIRETHQHGKNNDKSKLDKTTNKIIKD